MPRPFAFASTATLAVAIGCAIGCAGASRPSPAPAPAAPPRPAATAPLESSPPIAPTPKTLACPAIDVPMPEIAHVEGIDVDVPDIVDADDSLAPFYAKLARLMRGKATDHLRIAMFGDSNMTMDFITGHMRRWWQGRFGDAGHGWISSGRPWEWYHHMDVRHGAFLKSFIHWAVSTHAPADKLIGFSGIAAQSVHEGATSYVQTADEGSPIGTKAQTFEVYWLARPGGGSFEVVADREMIDEIDTFAYEPHAEFQKYVLEDGRHRFSLVATSSESVRLFGVTMERMPETGPSVVIDSLGCGAMSAEHLAKREDQALNQSMLAHRRYDLVLELVGSNTRIFYDPADLSKQWATIVATHRAANPDVAFMMMSPPDMARTITSKHSEPRIVRVGEQKRRIAKDLKVAFWDFREAMGGDLSIVRFRRHGMAAHDLIHFAESGAAYMAGRIDLALMRGFARWLEKHPDAGCE